MSQKLLFIFNPHAGKGQIKNHLVDIVDMMVKAGFDVTIYTTQAQADATRKVVEESHRTGAPQDRGAGRPGHQLSQPDAPFGCAGCHGGRRACL